MARKLLLCIMALLVGVATCMADSYLSTSEANCKTVDLSGGKKLKSLIDKQEISTIKKIIIKGETEFERYGKVNTFVTLKDYEFLAKMPALETLVISKKLYFDGKITEAITKGKVSPLKIKTLVIEPSGVFESVAESLEEDCRVLPRLANNIENNWNNVNVVGAASASKGISSLAAIAAIDALNNILTNLSESASHGNYGSEGVVNLSAFFPNIERVIYSDAVNFKLSQGKLPERIYFSNEGEWRASLLRDGSILHEKKSVDRNFKGYHIVNASLYKNNFEGDLSQAIYADAVVLKDKSNPSKVFVPKNVRFIGNDESYNSIQECNEIVFEEGNDLLYIQGGAFSQCKVRNLTFCRPVYLAEGAFSQVSMENVTFNKGVEYFSIDTFDKIIGKMTFSQVPQKIKTTGWHKYIGQFCQNYDIPEGTERQFTAVGFPEEYLFERSSHRLSMTIELKKPNSLLSVLSEEKLRQLDSLTIIGFMYETDLAAIEKSAKYLRYLNIAKTYITYSPQKQADMQANSAALASLFSALGVAADMKYDDGKMSSLDHAYTKGFSQLMSDALVTKAVPGCIIPRNALNDMHKLETLILPERASEIQEGAFAGCESLKNLKLPKYLTWIGSKCFNVCESLEEVDFPSTLTHMGGFVYSGLRKIDLSKCTFTNNDHYYGGRWCFGFGVYGYLQELRIPKGVKNVEVYNVHPKARLYVPSSVKTLDIESNGIEIHFASPTPPIIKGNGTSNSTIYVPKGAKTAYYSHRGLTRDNTFIEE